MCQFNLIIIKTPASAAYLERLGYYLAYPLQYDYTAWCWGRRQFCNCGSVAGSVVLKGKGKYPETLCHNDYRQTLQESRRYLQEQIVVMEAAKERQLTAGFAEEKAKFKEEEKKYLERLKKFDMERYANYEKYHDPSALESPPGEEESALQNELIKLREKDPVLFEAVSTPVELMAETLKRLKNYGIYDRRQKEFRYYRRIFSRLLKSEDCVYFTHIWDRPGELQLVNTLALQELRISDLALLAENDVIRIRRW